MLIRRRLEARFALGAAAELKAAVVHADEHVVLDVAVGLDADVGRGEAESARACGGCRCSCTANADGVDGRVAQHHRVADGERMRLVVAAALARDQDVLRLQLQRRRPLDRGEHVAAEHRVVRAELHVDLADVLRFVLRSAAAVGRRGRTGRSVVGQLLGDLQRGRAERRAGLRRLLTKGARRLTRAGRVALGRRVLREVAGKHRGRRHEGEQIRRRFAQPRALIRAEEEQAVGRNRTAERAAELVAAQAVALALTGGRVDRVERVGRVEAVVADELEQVAVKQVRARLGHGVDRGARVHAVVGVRRARLEPELLQRVGKRQRQVQVVVRVVVRGAVEQIGHAERPDRRRRQSPCRPACCGSMALSAGCGTAARPARSGPSGCVR